MTTRELLQESRDMLQDANKNYWSDSELLNHYNAGIRNLASERKEKPTTITVSLIDDTYEYDVDGVLRYISAVDSDGNKIDLYPDDTSGDDQLNGAIILDYDRIYVNNPSTGTTLSIKTISMPTEKNLNDTVRSGDEETLKYYILSKAYEKEGDMENFQKAQYFSGEFMKNSRNAKKNSSMNFIDQTETTKGYYY